MLVKKIQALYAKKMLNQIIKEVNVKPLVYEITAATGEETAVLLSYKQWQTLQKQLNAHN